MKFETDSIAQPDNDKLNRNFLAQKIAEHLNGHWSHSSEGISIAITGEWGSGKSTMVNFISQAAKSQNSFLKIHYFSPWLFQKNGSIREIILIELAKFFNDLGTKGKSISKEIQKLIRPFAWIKKMNSSAEFIYEFFEHSNNFFAEDESLVEIKKRIDNVLSKNRNYYLVIIDDVDRLKKEQVIELFQTISMVSNFSRVIYIVAYDREIITNLLQLEYGSRAQDFLEKIFLVEFNLPKIRKEVMQDIFFQNITQLELSNEIEFDRKLLESIWNYGGLKNFFNNYRDIKRYFNSLSITIRLVLGKVNYNQFITLEAIRIFYYKSYEAFYEVYRNHLSRGTIDSPEYKAQMEREIDSQIYFLINKISDKVNFSVIRNSPMKKDLRDPAFFENYFSLFSNPMHIDDKSLFDFIRIPSRRKAIIEDVIRDGIFNDFIYKLQDTQFLRSENYDFKIIEDLIIEYGEKYNELESYFVPIEDAIYSLISNSKKIPYFKEKFIDGLLLNLNRKSIYFYLIFFEHFIKEFDVGATHPSSNYNGKIYEAICINIKNMEEKIILFINENTSFFKRFFNAGQISNVTYFFNKILYRYRQYINYDFYPLILNNKKYWYFLFNSRHIFTESNGKIIRVDLIVLDNIFDKQQRKEFLQNIFDSDDNGLSEEEIKMKVKFKSWYSTFQSTEK